MSSNKEWKATFPLTKIKHIMKLDESVGNVSADANYAVTCATQLFLELLVLESHQFSAEAGRKTITYQDVASAISEIHEFEFLSELVPLTLTYKDALEKRRAFEEQQQAAKEDFA